MIIDLDKLDRDDIVGLIDLKMADLERQKAEILKRRQGLNDVRGLTDEELAALISAKQNEIDSLNAKIAELAATKGKL